MSPVATRPLQVAVLMTTFNRRLVTERGLAALRLAAAGCPEARFELYVADDGSSDGTVAAVQRLWPEAVVLEGRDLYWCRGMHLAFAAALKTGFDAYLWLNDDTQLQPDALARLLACERLVSAGGQQAAIVVGSAVDGANRLTYGGHRCRSRLRPLALARTPPTAQPQRIDTMNGNIVWINAEAVRRTGNLDPLFEHAMGDVDYGLRAGRAGVALWLAPGVHGLCSHNPIRGTHEDRNLPLQDRWTLLLGRKGLPWRSWLLLTRRHARWVWPALFMWPYVRLLASGLRRTSP